MEHETKVSELDNGDSMTLNSGQCTGRISGGIDRDWLNLVTFLFVLQAEFGVEAEVQTSYDILLAALVAKTTAKMSSMLKDTLGVILRCAFLANYRTFFCLRLPSNGITSDSN